MRYHVTLQVSARLCALSTDRCQKIFMLARSTVSRAHRYRGTRIQESTTSSESTGYNTSILKLVWDTPKTTKTRSKNGQTAFSFSFKTPVSQRSKNVTWSHRDARTRGVLRATGVVTHIYANRVTNKRKNALINPFSILSYSRDPFFFTIICYSEMINRIIRKKWGNVLGRDSNPGPSGRWSTALTTGPRQASTPTYSKLSSYIEFPLRYTVHSNNSVKKIHRLEPRLRLKR